MHRIKALFICTLIILGIGAGLSFCYDSYLTKKCSDEIFNEMLRTTTFWWPDYP